MRSFIRIGWIVLIFWAAWPISASAQSANDVFNLLDRVLRRIPDAGDQPPPADQTVRQPDRRVAPAEPAPRYQAPRYTRADVRETQRILNELGYDAGPVDGAYGRRTRGALIAFQQDEGLAVNGEISDRVLTRLRRLETEGAPAIAQGGCTPIRFARGTSAAEITGIAPADGLLCYTLETLNGQTASIEVIEGANVIFLVPGLFDAANRYEFTTEQKTYEIMVGQMMRAVVGVPFRIRLSVTGAAREAGGEAKGLESGAGMAIAGVYCQRDGAHKLAIRETAGGGIEFAITSWQGGGHHCGASGRARPSPTGWRYEANMSGAGHERCAINFAYDHGVTLSVDRDARCRSQCGARATLDGLLFPESSRLGRLAAPSIFENPEFYNNVACNRNSLTISAAPVPRPRVASGTAGLPDMAAPRAALANSAPADGGPAEGLGAGSAQERAGNTIERSALDLHQDISCANRPAEEDYATPVLVPLPGDGAITYFYSHDRDIIRVGKAETAQQYHAGAGDDLIFLDGPVAGTQIWGGNGADTIVVCAIDELSTHIDMGPHDTAPDLVVIEEAVFTDPPDGNPEIWVSGLVTVNDRLVLRVPDESRVTFGDSRYRTQIDVGSVKVKIMPPLSIGAWRQFDENAVVIVTSSGRRIAFPKPRLLAMPRELEGSAVVAAEPITLAGNAPAGWLGRGACPKPAEIATQAVSLASDESFETPFGHMTYGPADDTVVFVGDPWAAEVIAGTGNDTIYVYQPASGTIISGGAEADTIILCAPADDGVSLTLELGGTYSSDIDPDTVIIGPDMLLEVPAGFQRKIIIFQFTPANDRVILRLPEGAAVSYIDEGTGAVLLRAGNVEISLYRADDWLDRPFNWDSVILLSQDHAGSEPATPGHSISTTPVTWQWGEASTYAGAPASMVELTPNCGEMRDPASPLEITKPLDDASPEFLDSSGHDIDHNVYFSHGDDLIRLANTRNAMQVTAGRGDDAIYFLDIGDGLSVNGGSGADVFVICSMHGAELSLSLGPGLSSVDRHPDLVVIEPAVFLNIPDGFQRVIAIFGFLSVNDRLELRVPPGLEVEPDDVYGGALNLKIGQVTVTIFLAQSQLDFDSSSVVVVPGVAL